MYKFTLTLLLSTCLFTLWSQERQVFTFSSKANDVVQVVGQLEDGTPMADLSWAWNSSNACFVEIQAKKFRGHHVLYRTEIPPRSEMTIRIIPEDPKDNYSLYAYSGGGDAIVPALSSCVSCEADYKWDYKYRGKTQDHTRSVQLRAVNNPYPVTIGVVGPSDMDKGAFVLEVTVNGGE